MHAESNALRQSFAPQPVSRSSWPQLVMFGLGVDSWRERAISEVRGLRDERGPTQLGIYTRTSLSWIPGSRYACPRMTEEKIILSLPALFFFLSLPDLIRQSTNTRHLLTICTQKATRFNKDSYRSRCCGQAGHSLSLPCFSLLLSSVIPVLDTGIQKEVFGSRPNMMVKKKAEHDREKNPSTEGLDKRAYA